MLKSIVLLLVIDIFGFMFFLVTFYLKKTKLANKTDRTAPMAWMHRRSNSMPVLSGEPNELPLTNTTYNPIKEDMENTIRYRNSAYK